MQYPFTEEQTALAQLTRDFMEQEVASAGRELDREHDPKDCYPKELIHKASKLGLRTISLPEEFGGINADTTTKTLVLWTGAQIEVGTIKCLSQCWKVSTAISKCGTKDQKDRWLKMFAEDNDAVGSIALTEPDFGSDNMYRQPDPKLGLRLSAVDKGDHFILNGTKRFTSLAGFSRIILVFARTDPSAPLNEGTTCFIVHGDTPGVTYGRVHDKLGYRLYPNGEIYFDNARISKEDVLGEVNQGFQAFGSIFRGSAELAACNTGLCRGLFEICHSHAKERIQGGKPIIEHPTVRHMLAEMLMNIEVGEQYMWRTCWGVDNDGGFNPRFTRFGKGFTDQVGIKSIQLALDILGGNGIMKDFPSEKYIRDILTFQHGDGTGSITFLRAAQTLNQPV